MKKPSEILVSLTINENDIKVHQITSNFIILKRENDILSPELGGFNRYHFVGSRHCVCHYLLKKNQGYYRK